MIYPSEPLYAEMEVQTQSPDRLVAHCQTNDLIMKSSSIQTSQIKTCNTEINGKGGLFTANASTFTLKKYLSTQSTQTKIPIAN